MNNKHTTFEKGQTLVLVVIGFLVFVAVLALVLDGGNAYAARRQAQNAADAGALAGATYMCKHRNEAGALTQAIGVAEDYAVLNEAVDPPGVFASLTNANVIVTATVTRTTFFAGLIGFNEVSPMAVAEAACRPPGVGVLPVAWSCRENVVGELTCVEDIGPCRSETDPKGMGCTYLIMDTVKVKKGSCIPCDPALDPECDPSYCQNDLTCAYPIDPPTDCSPDIDPLDPLDANLIDCDIDDDCVDDLAAGGSRSWLDLDGAPAGGAAELKGWISGAVQVDPLDVHTWLAGQSGGAVSLFKTAKDYILGEEIILPVFNKSCDGYPIVSDPETLSYCNAGSIDNLELIDGVGPGTFTFHIISFSAFHVTCVEINKKGYGEAGYFLDANDKDCYGHQAAVSAGSIDLNDNTIEGYFVRQNLGGYGGPGSWYDTGTFTVVLVR